MLLEGDFEPLLDSIRWAAVFIMLAKFIPDLLVNRFLSEALRKQGAASWYDDWYPPTSPLALGGRTMELARALFSGETSRESSSFRWLRRYYLLSLALTAVLVVLITASVVGRRFIA